MMLAPPTWSVMRSRLPALRRDVEDERDAISGAAAEKEKLGGLPAPGT